MNKDPYGGSVSKNDPGTWNRFNYGRGDSVNNNDPDGRGQGVPGSSYCHDNPSDPECSPVCFLPSVPVYDWVANSWSCGVYDGPWIGDDGGGAGSDSGGGVSSEHFLGTYESNARADLGKPECFALFGFTNGKDAQSAFDKIRFNYMSMGKLIVANNAPAKGTPAPAQTLGYGTVNINTDYNWGDFSKVRTAQGGSYDYLGYMNRTLRRNMNSEQLGTMIILHELGHQQMWPKSPSDVENAAEKIAILEKCIK